MTMEAQSLHADMKQMENGTLAAPFLAKMGPFAATGGPFSVAAGRVSITFGFKGPAVSKPNLCIKHKPGMHPGQDGPLHSHWGALQCRSWPCVVHLRL